MLAQKEHGKCTAGAVRISALWPCGMKNKAEAGWRTRKSSAIIRNSTCGALSTMDKKKSIELLNQAVADELQAVHQYLYFHFHLADQGFGPLSMLFKRTAIMEMGHVELLAERILFLKGDVKMAASGPVEIITDAEAMLVKAMAMEEGSVQAYNDAAIACSANSDSASKQLFEQLVKDEEGHYDQFEKQRDNIKRFGPSYLALQSFGGASEGTAAG
jgi:bacterioferritin